MSKKIISGKATDYDIYIVNHLSKAERQLFPEDWLVTSLAMTTGQVSAWKNDDKPLPEIPSDGLASYHLFHPGIDGRKELYIGDPEKRRPHFYDKKTNCIWDGVVNTSSSCACVRIYHLRLPFQWIDYLHSLETESRGWAYTDRYEYA